MSDRFTIEVNNTELLQAINHALPLLERPIDLMQVIGASLQQNVNLRFISKTDPRGAPWKPLAEATLEHKKGRGSILEHFNLMKSSLGYNAADAFVEVGFGESYAAFHETGTRHMPARPLLSADFEAGLLGQQDQDDVLEDVRVYLNGLGL